MPGAHFATAVSEAVLVLLGLRTACLLEADAAACADAVSAAAACSVRRLATTAPPHPSVVLELLGADAVSSVFLVNAARLHARTTALPTATPPPLRADAAALFASSALPTFIDASAGNGASSGRAMSGADAAACADGLARAVRAIDDAVAALPSTLAAAASAATHALSASSGGGGGGSSSSSSSSSSSNDVWDTVPAKGGRARGSARGGATDCVAVLPPRRVRVALPAHCCPVALCGFLLEYPVVYVLKHSGTASVGAQRPDAGGTCLDGVPLLLCEAAYHLTRSDGAAATPAPTACGAAIHRMLDAACFGHAAAAAVAHPGLRSCVVFSIPLVRDDGPAAGGAAPSSAAVRAFDAAPPTLRAVLELWQRRVMSELDARLAELGIAAEVRFAGVAVTRERVAL